MTGTPIEVWEDLTGLRIVSKTVLADSGGAGEFRGGVGQRIEIVNDTDHPMSMSCLAGRTVYAPAGALGGRPGALRRIALNGKDVHPKGRYVLNPGDCLVTYEAGGGGFGDPGKRRSDALRDDLEQGYVTREGVKRDYGIDLEV
jgi:N-methylhydantoinase B